MNSQKAVVSTRKSLSRIALQVFVWALVIAFVSTLGVMWDGSAGGGFPVVIKSSKGKVDLSPRDLYMLEYNKLYEDLKEDYADMDPRFYTKLIQNVSLTNTEKAFTEQLFYEDIQLKPSPKRFQEIQANTGVSSNLVDFQYAEFQYSFPLGVVPMLSSPTVSDMYVFNDLQWLHIATELLVLNKTNFLFMQVTDEELSEYYYQNFEKWIDSITVQEIQVENRGQARRVVNLLKSHSQEEVFDMFATSNDTVISKDKTITIDSSNYTYANEILLSFKSNQTIVGPIYDKGQYSVVIITNISSLDTVSPSTKYNVMLDFITENYTALEKKYSTEWKNALSSFKVENNDSFGAIAEKVDGSVHHTIQPFTVLQYTITNVHGVQINLPVLSNPDILNGLLYTPLNTSSDVISVQDELHIFVRPLLREHRQGQMSAEQIYEDPNLYQNIYTYKEAKLKEMSSSKLLKNKYKITVDRQVLTNLN